jgi:hypothetical protein
MHIYLVQSGQCLNGSDGYSYGLLHGEQSKLLVSFVDFMQTGNHSINPAVHPNRRKLTMRQQDRKKVAP